MRRKLKNGWIQVVAVPVTLTVIGKLIFYLNKIVSKNVLCVSSVPEWESSIDETTGELLYIDCIPHVTQNPTETPPKFPSSFVKNVTRQSTRSKFLRLIRRRESKRRSKHWQIDSKVKFQVSDFPGKNC